jgi:hypothetical protein
VALLITLALAAIGAVAIIGTRGKALQTKKGVGAIPARVGMGLLFFGLILWSLADNLGLKRRAAVGLVSMALGFCLLMLAAVLSGVADARARRDE